MRDGEKFRLGDLCSITKGETPIKQAVPGRYQLVVTAAERNTHKTFQFDCRAVIVPLVSSTGHGHASIKRIHFQEGKFALGSILCAVVPKDEKRLNAEFLHVYFSYFKDQLIVPVMKGSANVSLSVSTLAEMKIIVPPMDVQMRVIRLSKNDALMKPLEDELTHQETLLAKLKQAILQEAIQGKLTADWRAANPQTEPASQLLHRIQAEKARLIAAKKIRPEKPLSKITPAEIPFEIPKGLEWCRYGDLCEYVTSGSRGWQQFYADIGALFIRAQNIKTDKLCLDDEAFVDLPNKAEGLRARVLKHDVLITITGGNLVKTALVEDDFEEAYVSQHIALTRLVNTDLAKWIHIVLTTDRGLRGVLLGYSRGDKPGLNLPNVRQVPIPLPPLAEQAAIVERVEALMATCRALEAEVEHSRNHASHLLQAVLKEAFSKET